MLFPVSKQFREVIHYRASGNLKSEAAKTYLSFFWWILEPILFLGVYYLVFGVIFGSKTENFLVFLLIGLVFWQWFASSVAHAANSIKDGKSLITQICFPKIVLPSIVILMAMYKSTLVFVILLLFLFIFGFTPTISYVYLPLIFILQFFLICSVGYVLSILVAFMPDIKMLVPLFLRLLMYMSAIFYSLEGKPEWIQQLFFFNPVATCITAYRDILMYSIAPDFQLLGYTALGVLLLYAFGVYLLYRLDSILPRVMIQQ